MRIRREKTPVSWLVVVGLAVLSTGFVVQRLDSQARGAPYVTRGPRASVDSLSDSELVRYIGSLRFEASPWAGDQQRLLVGRYVADSPGLARYGPLVTIQPAEGNNHFSRRDLTQGRIVARFINQEADSYPKLGVLPHSVTYWWVEGDYRAGAGRSVFIATDSEGGRLRILRRKHAGLRYEAHPEYRYPLPYAAARWYWYDRDEQGWYPCPTGCCRSGAE